jgi:hypothetical protein
MKPSWSSLVGIGSSALLLAAAILSFPGRALAQAQLVDIATNLTDPLNLRDSEPSIAVNPANPQQIAVVSFSGNWGAAVNAPVWISNNGGAAWQNLLIIPAPPGGFAGPLDQKVAFNAQGNLFVAAMDSTFTAFIYRQTAPLPANLTVGAAYGDDQPHLDVDGFAFGNCFNSLYSPFRNGPGPGRPPFNPVLGLSAVATSVNQGAAMANVAVGNNATFPNRTTRIALAPDGRAYVIYKTQEGAVAGVSLPNSGGNDFENAHFWVRRSDNCGANWNAIGGAAGVSVHGANAVQTFFTQSFGDAGKGQVARARSSDAWIAVDPSDGDIYAAYVSRDNSGFGQIYAARSRDRGATWTNSRITNGAFHSAYPEIAVGGNGTVGVLYIDFDNSGPSTLFRHRFARSFDDGATWADQILQSMNPALLANAAGTRLWIDYEGLTALGNTFYGVFTGQSIGRVPPELDPIFFTETAVRAPVDRPACLDACDRGRERCMDAADRPEGTLRAKCMAIFRRCQRRCYPPPRLTIRSRLAPSDDPGRFNLQLNGLTKAAAVGDGGTTGALTLSAGNHTVGQTPAAGTNVAQYVTVIGRDCAASGAVAVAAGDNKTCTITNTRRPAGPTREQCLDNCDRGRERCMDAAGADGPRQALCMQAFRRCQRGCPES